MGKYLLPANARKIPIPQPNQHLTKTQLPIPSISCIPSAMQPLYLDNQSTTPLDPRVLQAMLATQTQGWANPHAVQHAFGWQAADVVDSALATLATLTGFQPDEIILTSGATESNNLAFKGLAAHLQATGRTHILVSSIEHACVLACAAHLQTMGFEAEIIPVTPEGLVTPAAVANRLRPTTGLVSVMLVNNEIGTIQPVNEIAALARANGTYRHTDAAQALGRLPLINLDADLISLTAHKAYGPKGIGALAVRKALHRHIQPQLHGGGQQHGLRSGTLAPMLCAGFAAAAKLAEDQRETDTAHAQTLATALETILRQSGIAYTVQGSRTQRIPHNLNLRFAGVPTDALQTALPHAAFSSGSACTTEGDKPSHVLAALGLPAAAIPECFRIAIGRTTTQAGVEAFANQLVEVLKTLTVA